MVVRLPFSHPTIAPVAHHLPNGRTREPSPWSPARHARRSGATTQRDPGRCPQERLLQRDLRAFLSQPTRRPQLRRASQVAITTSIRYQQRHWDAGSCERRRPWLRTGSASQDDLVGARSWPAGRLITPEVAQLAGLGLAPGGDGDRPSRADHAAQLAQCADGSAAYFTELNACRAERAVGQGLKRRQSDAVYRCLPADQHHPPLGSSPNRG
jgi:hypothetical protein